jgi:MFS family permease
VTTLTRRAYAGGRVTRSRLAVSWVFFANGAALGSWVPHIPDAKHALALDDGVLGLSLLAMAAGSLVGLPLSGALTAHFGSRGTTTVAILAVLVATPLPILAPSLPLFALALAALGVANGGVDVAMNAQAIAIEERLGWPVMSSFHGLFSAGGLAGAAGAALAMSAGVGPRSHVLAAAAGLLLVSLGAVAFLLPASNAAAAPGPVFRVPRGPLLGLGMLALCALLAEGAVGDWAAVYLRDYAGSSAEVAALGFAGFSLAMSAGRLLGDRVIRRCGGRAVLSAGGGVAAVLLAAGLLAGSPWVMLLGFAAVGLGLANAVPILFSAAGRIADVPPSIGIAAVSTAGYCGFLLGPPVIGLVGERFGLGTGLGLIVIALAMLAMSGSGRLVARMGAPTRSGLFSHSDMR